MENSIFINNFFGDNTAILNNQKDAYLISCILLDGKITVGQDIFFKNIKVGYITGIEHNLYHDKQHLFVLRICLYDDCNIVLSSLIDKKVFLVTPPQ